MAYTQADLDALDATILLNGATLRMRFQDREEEFQSIDQMIKFRAFVAEQVAAASQSIPKRQMRIITSKGF